MEVSRRRGSSAAGLAASEGVLRRRGGLLHVACTFKIVIVHLRERCIATAAEACWTQESGRCCHAALWIRRLQCSCILACSRRWSCWYLEGCALVEMSSLKNVFACCC